MPEIIVSDYFYGNGSEEFIYFKIPRQLITLPEIQACLHGCQAAVWDAAGPHEPVRQERLA